MIRPSMSPVSAIMPATPLRRYASSSMVRFPTLIAPCRPCDNTASAALMKGWISSIFMSLDSRSGCAGHGAVIAEHVLDDFIEHFRLYRLLHEMPRATLQGGHDVFLVADRRDHDHARIRMLLHDALGRFDPFHLRHGDIHEHDVRMRAVVFADCSQAVAGLGRHLPAEGFDHASQVLTGENRVVYDQVANRLPVLAAFYRCKLLHKPPLLVSIAYHVRPSRDRSRWSRVNRA